MAFEERVQILSEAEQDELYGPPAFTSADQRFFFSLNDKELAIAKSLRHRGQRYMLVVLLGYFKAKPVVLNPGFHQIQAGPQIRLSNRSTRPSCRPFNLTPKENERIYQRVFQLCNYQRWNVKDHGAALRDYLSQQARAWTAPRHLFDAAMNIVRGRRSQSLPTARCKRSSVRWWETNRTHGRAPERAMSRGLSKHWRSS
ncbi:DUF4158 domain-containing protein [Klebsiella pneumoniae]|uniref:DUF4158 domain-containing protein n=1 Tax=Klebsiella pneumoniae TaxID=573 RepID=UPI0014310D8F|nr:DUF4158 domain-containing protein [Klebsiella pneumoniae]